MAIDTFKNFADSPMAPASDCFAVQPSDSAQLPRVTKALYIGTSGDVNLQCVQSGAAVTFRNVGAGSFLDVRAVAVLATGTTADHIGGPA